MPLYTRMRTILAKIEVTEGTDPVPTGAANAILCSQITVTPLGGSTADRQLAFPSFGAVPKKHVNKFVQVQFDVELAGSGAAGTAPAWGVLARMCSHSEAITAATKVVYTPVTSEPETGTIYANESGTLHKLTGARGTMSMVFAADGIPVMKYTFTGRWTVPAEGSLPSLTTTAWIDPLPIGNVNTPTFTLDAYAAVMEQLQIDQANTVVHRDRPNAEYVAITDRLATGTLQIEAPALGTKDFFGLAYGDATMVAQLIHGTAAGNIIQLDVPKLQMLQPAYQDVNGIRHLTAQLTLNRTAGDDEYTLTVK